MVIQIAVADIENVRFLREFGVTHKKHENSVIIKPRKNLTLFDLIFPTPIFGGVDSNQCFD